jgi:hypothetical protein
MQVCTAFMLAGMCKANRNAVFIPHLKTLIEPSILPRNRTSPLTSQSANQLMRLVSIRSTFERRCFER